MKLNKTIKLIGVFLCLISSSNCVCPIKGKIGGKAVPDVLSLVKNQNGFSATIEIFTPGESTVITERYNGAEKYGSIEIDKLSQDSTEAHYYYSSTSDKFIIKDDSCISKTLTTDEKIETINSWINTKSEDFVNDLFGKMDYLGPTQLMIWAKSVSSEAQYVGSEKLDAVDTDHWFYCLFGGKFQIDWWFEASNKMPFRFSIGSGYSSEVYNFLNFQPLQKGQSELFSYPIGYGCRPSSINQPAIPQYLKVGQFSVDMEALIVYANPERYLVSSARMTKYQGTYSFEITEGPNSTRFIRNPGQTAFYVVDIETGKCWTEIFDFLRTSRESLPITWPYHQDVGFNLMNIVRTNARSNARYMGRVSTDSGVRDVWEESFTNFFSNADVADLSIAYYFPAIDRTQNLHQTPAKMVLKPLNKQFISMSQALPKQIEITFTDYQEDQFELSDQFDVTGCYDGPGEFTWFQIEMSDSGSGSSYKSLNAIREYFQEQLSTFIPVIRTPEIIINRYKSNYYVTVKLLGKPSFELLYYEGSNLEILNPTSILTKNTLKDCAKICVDANCYSFSYCSDSSCQIFIYDSENYLDYRENDSCSFYERTDPIMSEKIIEKNLLASVDDIFSQIKAKVDAGEFAIPKYSLSANNFFMISGPEEIGKVKESS